MKSNGAVFYRLSPWDMERFRLLLSVRENGCWEWIGETLPLDKDGKRRGVFRVDNNDSSQSWNLRADKVAFFFKHRRVPAQLTAPCGNSLCANPDHLTEVVTRKRQKLKPQDVEEIRRVFAAGEVTQVELAKRFNVTQAHVSYLVRS